MQSESEIINSRISYIKRKAYQLSYLIDRTYIDTDDLIQEGLIGCLQAIRKETETNYVDSQRDAYMYRTIDWRMMDRIRAVLQSRNQRGFLAHDFVSIDDENYIEHAEEHDYLHEFKSDFVGNILPAALLALTDKQQRVIDMLFFKEMKQREIAKTLEISEGMVSKIKSAALKNLRNSVG